MAAPISRQRMPCSIQNWRMALFGLRQREAAGGLRMGEVGRVEIQADAVIAFAQAIQFLNCSALELVAVHLLAAASRRSRRGG